MYEGKNKDISPTNGSESYLPSFLPAEITWISILEKWAWQQRKGKEEFQKARQDFRNENHKAKDGQLPWIIKAWAEEVSRAASPFQKCFNVILPLK